MSITVIPVASYEPAYLGIVEHLVRTEQKAGNEALVYDISALLATPVDGYHRGVLRLFRLRHPGHDLADRIAALGARFEVAGPVTDETEVAPLSPELEEALAISTRSALITFYRTDRIEDRGRTVRATAARMAREGRAVYRRTRDLLAAEPRIRSGYVGNGRFPHQKMMTLAFRDAGVTWRHFEKGQTPDRVYVQDYSPHDRFRSQGSVDDVLAGRDRTEVERIADAWLAARAPAVDSHNEYTTLWRNTLPPQIAAWQRAGDRIAGFFTSSQDEFLFQGAEWQVHEWADQFDAFDQIMTRFEARGYRTYLRVHPNLTTRAHDYFRRERASIRALAARHPGLVVIWHDDPANSYRLLEVTDAVVVFASTIGVEASARGIPVWSTAAAPYGEVADIREPFGPGDLTDEHLEPWDVDPYAAKRFIAFQVIRDQHLDIGNVPWTPWEGMPLGARLAAIPRSGGTPGMATAIWSLVDQYRHRSLRANWRTRRAIAASRRASTSRR